MFIPTSDHYRKQLSPCVDCSCKTLSVVFTVVMFTSVDRARGLDQTVAVVKKTLTMSSVHTLCPVTNDTGRETKLPLVCLGDRKELKELPFFLINGSYNLCPAGRLAAAKLVSEDTGKGGNRYI